MIDETFLTTEEVLEYLQVNLRTVYRLIKAGKIPAVRVGRQWRFRKRDIDAWLDSQRARGSASRSVQTPPRRAAALAAVRAPPRPGRRRRSQHPRPARRRRWRSPNTTSTSHLMAAPRSSACGCIRTTC